MTSEWDGQDTERIRAMIARRFGLGVDDSKIASLVQFLGKRSGLRDRGHDLDDLRASDPELTRLAEELTVPETYFFRHSEQFSVLGDVALPEVLESRAAHRPVKILSAGCSSGEEPYSIAMTIEARFPGLTRREIDVKGVDMAPSRLERARLARYPSWSFRETSEEARTRWFQQKGQEFRVVNRIRDTVDFELVNLADDASPLWEPESCDVVFCRNVMMYFAPDRARELMGRISRALTPGGYLFLGHAETLHGLSQDFHLLHAHGAFYYRRKGKGEPGRPYAGGPANASVPHPSAPALNVLARAAGSWVEVIGRATDRIQALHAKRPTAGDAARVEAAQTRDLARAMALLQHERYQEALACVAPSSRVSERDPEVLLLRAVLQVHSGTLAEAEETCRLLLGIDELHSGAHYVIALCREALGDGRRAAEHDWMAAHLDPGFAMPRLHLGLLARRGGEPALARSELGHALVLLEREDPSRLLLFGGGFGREALVALCRAELSASGDAP